MQILGNRILVSKIEEPKQEGFETVSPTDSFLYKGMVVQSNSPEIVPESIVLFAKYSPDTHEVDVNGMMMKIINVSDVLAVYEK